MATQLVHCSIVGPVATITLDSPTNRNALSRALVADLHTALDTVEQSAVRVIVVGHTGPTFCAGADLKERLAGPVDSTPMVRAFRRLMDAPQATIAALTGGVRAGGVGLMASCDLVVVPPTVDFAFTEVRIGAVPAIISVPILRRCPPAKLVAAYLTGNAFSAAHALEIGLVSHVTDDVAATVKQLVAALLKSAPAAVTATKGLLRAVPDMAVDEAFAAMQQLSEEMFAGAEAAEGMDAFLAKRTPSWAPATQL
ncbi:MAG TPA: enoyl-CoA hydratase-related protein [Ilumatobacteraceae bacterium]